MFESPNRTAYREFAGRQRATVGVPARYPRSGDWALLLCTYFAVVAAAAGLVASPLVSAGGGLLALAVIFVCVTRRRLSFMLPIFILFVPVNALSQEWQTLAYYNTMVPIGFPAIGLLVAAPRVYRERRSFMVGFPKRFLMLYGATLLFASAAMLKGYEAGNNGWSRPLHLSLPLAGFVVGLTMEPGRRRASSKGRSLFSTLLVAALFIIVPAIGGHLIFLLVGIVGALLGFAASSLKRWPMLLVVLPVQALLFVSATFTMSLIMALATLISFAVHSRFGGYRALRQFAFVAVPSTVFVTWYLAAARIVSQVGSAPLGTLNWVDGFRFKLLADRYPLYNQAGAQIASELPLVGAGGRPIFLYKYPNAALGVQEWTMGLHNVYLESLFQLGWLGGILLSLSMITVALVAFTILGRAKTSRPVSERDAFLSIAASTCLAIFAVAAVTGQFLVETAIGTWFWFALGVLVSARLRFSAAEPDVGAPFSQRRGALRGVTG